MTRTTLHTFLLAALVVTSCAAPRGSAPAETDLSNWNIVPDLPIAGPPYDRVTAHWKQRMEVHYVFLEHRGSYSDTGALIPVLHRELRAQGLEPDGPPFCLFYDDPSQVPASELRSRAAIPVRGSRAVLAPLAYEVLRSTTVGYAFVSGAYPDAPRAYPGVFAYLQGINWEAAGPVREIYLVPPGSNPDPSQLICEIQIPARPAGSGN
ncbi:MAG: GyrI-like domain-containing protein [Deltaproteobacteria bacterium]|nr:GyrI-like domain-containing protein [Deltaproteobacteria bacterium]